MFRVHVKSVVNLKAVTKVRLKTVVPMQSMKTWLNNYFGFTKREYNGLLALFGLIILAFVTPYTYEVLFSKTEASTDFEKNAIQELNLIALKEHSADPYYHSAKHSNIRATLFKFDPNQIDIEEWRKLGLSAKQAQSILNYRNKGGKFYKADDLRKMYAISTKMFKRLQPYIEIEGAQKYIQKVNDKAFKKELLIIEINTADTVKLDQIKGIGATFARRIANYRERLGGFYKKEQLMEVYGLDSLKFEEIKAQIQVDVSEIKKININTADFDTFKKHPYLKYKQINAIIQYRKQHGDYTSIADLKKLLILSPQTIEQIAPYLQF